MLHSTQGLLLDKIDWSQSEGKFVLLPLLQVENATLQKWQELQTMLDGHRKRRNERATQNKENRVIMYSTHSLSKTE
jgi:hypothetical protein